MASWSAAKEKARYLQTGAERARKIGYIQTAFIATVSVLNLLAVKMTGLYWDGEVVQLFGVLPLYFSMGALLYAITFPCTDIVSELLGARSAARLVWAGFFCSLGVVSVCQLAVILPAADFWQGQEAYAMTFRGVPRVMAASILSYLVSQRLDVLFFDRAIRYAQSGARLLSRVGDRFWKRALLTSISSQLIDSAIFVTVAFWGTEGIPLTGDGFSSILLPIIIATWLVKGFLTVPLVGVIFILKRWIGYSSEEMLPDELIVSGQAAA